MFAFHTVRQLAQNYKITTLIYVSAHNTVTTCDLNSLQPTEFNGHEKLAR